MEPASKPPPIPAASPPAARSPPKGSLPPLFRRIGCLVIWLVFVTPVIYSLLLVYFPALGVRLAGAISGPPLLQQWLLPGPAHSLQEWLGNADAGPTMVYLIFAAVLILFT